MRAGRLLSLLLLLQTRERMTARQLATELEVSPRTIYRDVESLAAAGVPVYADRGPDGGYRLLHGFRTRLNGLTTAEAETLFLTGMPGPATELGLGDLLAAAELKLVAALPPDLRPHAARIRGSFHLDTSGWFRDPDHVPHLMTVADAVWNHRRLHVRYRRWRRPQHLTRHLDPLGLVLKAGSWYLIARTSDTATTGTGTDGGGDDGGGDDGTLRTYRVSRILDVHPLPDQFDHPTGFDLTAHWHAYTEQFKADTYRDHVTVRLTPEGRRRAAHLLPPVMARAIADQTPPDPGHWTRADVPVESLRHAHTEFLKLAEDAEILHPPELRTRMAATARALTARYDTPPHPTPDPRG